MTSEMTPKDLRSLIRSRRWTGPTSGACTGRIQANLVMMPREQAFDFLLFCVRNPKPCPLLDVLEPGRWEPTIAPGADLRTDIPRYCVYEHGRMVGEVEDVRDLVDPTMVSFLLGCSFSFENAMLAGGLPVRNIEEGRNVSMYVTARDCVPAGPFRSKLVVTMRPMTPVQAVRAVQITTRFHLTHGAPVHIGSPDELGIRDLAAPEFGDPVTVRPGEVTVFWACGVTSQLAATSVDLPRVITHSPGHMFVSDLRDEDLTIL